MARARPPSAEHARRRSPPTRSRSAGPPRPGATTLCCAGRGPCTHRPNVVGGADICWVIAGRVSTECSCTQRHRRTTSRSRHAIPHSLSPLGVHLGGRSVRSGSAAGQPRYRGGVRGRCRRRIRYGPWSRLRRREGHGQFLSAGCCGGSTRYRTPVGFGRTAPARRWWRPHARGQQSYPRPYDGPFRPASLSAPS